MRKENLVGQQFGRLLVIEEVPPVSPDPKQNRPSWKCICSCGNPEPIIVYRGTDLKSGNSQSCGCLRKETSAKAAFIIGTNARKLDPITALAKSVFDSSYSEKEDTLTFEQFLEMCKLNCFYCGITPSNMQKPNKHSQKHVVDGYRFIYNGLDRYDNNLPHIYENCVPACQECNSSKRDMPIEQYYQMIKNIILFKKDSFPNYKEEFANFEGDLSRFESIKSTLLRIYQDINFEYKLLFYIVSKNCFYCNSEPIGKTKSSGNFKIIIRNGIDRINNNYPHILENCVACCKFCNWSKAKRSSSQFISWAERVFSHQLSQNNPFFLDTPPEILARLSKEIAPISHQETSANITLIA